MKWQWFVGGKKMLWVSIITLIMGALIFICTYIIDVNSIFHLEEQKMDTVLIREISENYVSDLGIVIKKPIVYRFVKYKHGKDDKIYLGSFHEWNDKYYIDISMDLYNMPSLRSVVDHETRHMVVEYLKDEKIIDLTKYSEDIAEGKKHYYNDLFNCGIYLLKESQK